jgi:catechol 2,3-dioxygenase-like lactoylglutathione lyase family enzyme
MSNFRAKTSYARLPVNDLQRSIAFYTDGAGFAVETLYPDDEPTFAALRNGDVHIEVYVAAPGQGGVHAGIVIEGSGVVKVYEAVKSKYEIEWGPEVFHYGFREFSVKDPDGHSIIFSEETEDPATCDG